MVCIDYIANARTWKAARELQAAASSRISFIRSIFFSPEKCVARSASRHGGSMAIAPGSTPPECAVHNIVRGLQEMQKVWRDASAAPSFQ